MTSQFKPSVRLGANQADMILRVVKEGPRGLSAADINSYSIARTVEILDSLEKRDLVYATGAGRRSASPWSIAGRARWHLTDKGRLAVAEQSVIAAQKQLDNAMRDWADAIGSLA